MSSEVEDRIANSSNVRAIQVSMSLCPKERLEVIATYARQCSTLPGEFWEMGVYMGGSASLIGKIAPNKVLRLFDSFEGVSEPQTADYPTQPLENGEIPMWKNEWRGDCNRALLNIGRDCILHKGWIPETFNEVPAESKVAFAHVDVDLYQPTLDSLAFILPRLSEGGHIVVDDFDNIRHPGIRTAIEKLLAIWPKLKGRVEVLGQVVLRLEEN